MKSTKQLLALLIIGLLFISCDKDYNTIGEGLVNETHFDQKAEIISVSTEAVNYSATPVQTDNLSYNLLGYYDDPVFGTTTANVITEVALSEYGKVFASDDVVSRVVLSIPYFSTLTGTDDVIGNTYVLDSVYVQGEENLELNKGINLKMYRSDYFLNDFDGTGDSQKYYSENNAFTTMQIANPANLLFEVPDFMPLPKEVTETVDGVESKLSPRFWRDDIDVSGFNWLVESTNATALSSASNFKNFFRGLYFEVSQGIVAGDAVMSGLDFSKAEIAVYYGKNIYAMDGITVIGVEEAGSIKILLTGKKVNLFNYGTLGLTPANNIVIKGGQGSMAKIDLFGGVDATDNDGNGIADKLDDLRNRDVLINEATLEFYVDKSVMIGTAANPVSEPNRLFLYDLDNNKTLLDYQFDQTSETDSNFTQLNHLGVLERDTNGEGVRYKIRITEHITDLIRNDSTNVSLGLVITNNVLSLGTSELKTPVVVTGGDDVESIFSSSVTSHRGTVLHNENAIDEDKKLKLRIYYTEENNN